MTLLFTLNLNIGIKIDNDIVCVLLYADDIVLLSENEQDLQILLTNLNDWCNKNDMDIDNSKSNVIHIRTESVPRSNIVFT